MTFFNAVTPGWFATYGTRLIAGRDFEARDDAGPPVAIVNEAFARHFFGARRAVGRRVRLRDRPRRDGRARDRRRGRRTPPIAACARTFPPTLYRPAAQMPEPPPFLNLDRADGARAARRACSRR